MPSQTLAARLAEYTAGLTFDKLTREEILDLLAYVYTRADKKHMLYGDHDHDH